MRSPCALIEFATNKGFTTRKHEKKLTLLRKKFDEVIIKFSEVLSRLQAWSAEGTQSCMLDGDVMDVVDWPSLKLHRLASENKASIDEEIHLPRRRAISEVVFLRDRLASLIPVDSFYFWNCIDLPIIRQMNIICNEYLCLLLL